jgi:hypothetical protein
MELTMKTYLFAAPLAAGKTETWKNYVKEITNSRFEEYKQSRQKAGIEEEQVYLQSTPQGDMCVVKLKGQNPWKSFESLIKSKDPFDTWFREKILLDAHGLDLSQPMPENEQFLDYAATSTREGVKTR